MDGIFIWILVGMLRALVTFNGNDLHEALDKEQKHVDGKGMAYSKGMCSSVCGQKREIENRDALFRKIVGKSYPGTTAGGIIDE
ncbi:hypothetical protein RCO48_39370 [Peribacillus frigoritolerans]|nr:hypothetical protein [Peribacillus frigoritolerans]